MKANEKWLLRFLDSSDTNFVIPVYQRNYDWKKEQCKQLYDDLVNVVKYDYKSHFFGTIVSIYNDSSRDREYLIIDGQQRITTVSLILLAIYNILNKGRLKSDKIRKEKIYNQYLVNPYMDDDSKLKLKPIKDDRKAFENIFNDEELNEESNISSNYKYFYERIIDGEISLDELYSAIERLMIVEIELKNGEDDPQLIFESLNSTGLDLTDADKVRNFILMDKTSKEQENLYNNYWNKVEKNTLYNVTSFIRDYMTMKEKRISNISKVYINFKSYIKDNNIDIKECLKDILKYSEYYNKILTSNTGVKEADEHLQKINKLEVRVSYPCLLEVIDDYNNGTITSEDLTEIFKVIESYIFRRIMCGVATNALNKVFMNLCKEIKSHRDYENNYVEVFKYVLANKNLSQRIPDDTEFKRNFLENNVYNWKSKNKLYLLERLENYNNTEKVAIEKLVEQNELSIEHIMPQNLTPSWIEMLGENYEEVKEKYLHTIGNLTLTGYNSQMSNRPFHEKKNIEAGFNNSRLKLNKYVASVDKWNEEEIKKRGEILFDLAKEIWEYPYTDYKIEKEKENLFYLSEEEDLTNSKVKGFSFMGIERSCKTWTELFEEVCKMLYDLDSVIFRKITKKDFGDEYLNKRFSSSNKDIRAEVRLAEDVYVEKNLNTNAKIYTLRILLDEYGIDYNELSYYIE
ncbi:uncharacterized protein with ParB-like and HNH nuclease domain [Clostridium moniliforme]|uniref:Uncharacterized protein with ParB-like and HNH nuclease domain n=1 Tax=Clostridium moniliforme TaxID=39489 RepID=A0ABS4EXU4_9CLOT|nr:DUF262 domain-containing protein [Clostridium moniliforme]MBP1888662.1 uncharacterized protein with ParB-like and HNH nuclease domain [Clostridium moniliforme]